VSRPIIEVHDFSYRYPRTSAPVLQDIDFSVHEGEFVGIVGPTGAGKTTLCLALCGLIPSVLGGQVTGEILIGGKSTAVREFGPLNFSSTDHTALVGITFQDPEAQLVGMTVEEDLAFGPENLGLPTEEIERRIVEVLKLVRVEGYRDVFPYHLSGGQKQRVAIGSTLTLRPKVLILDEPTSELDPVGRNEIFAIIRQLKEEANLSVLVVEHHTEELARFADRILVLHDGQLILDDAATKVFEQIDVLKSVGVRPPEGIEFLKMLQDEGIVNPGDGHMREEDIIAYLSRVLNGER